MDRREKLKACIRLLPYLKWPQGDRREKAGEAVVGFWEEYGARLIRALRALLDERGQSATLKLLEKELARTV